MAVNPNPVTAERFKQIRVDELKMSAAEMAKVLDTHPRTIFAYESGLSNVPGAAGALMKLLSAVPAARTYVRKLAGIKT